MSSYYKNVGILSVLTRDCPTSPPHKIGVSQIAGSITDKYEPYNVEGSKMHNHFKESSSPRTSKVKEVAQGLYLGSITAFKKCSEGSKLTL